MRGRFGERVGRWGVGCVFEPAGWEEEVGGGGPVFRISM